MVIPVTVEMIVTLLTEPLLWSVEESAVTATVVFVGTASGAV
jgi:hypothetical protein